MPWYEQVWLGALAIVWIFGGLAVWPLYRRARPQHRRRLVTLKLVFGAHVAALVWAFWLLTHPQPGDDEQTVILYIVGTISATLSALVIGVGAAVTRVAGSLSRE